MSNKRFNNFITSPFPDSASAIHLKQSLTIQLIERYSSKLSIDTDLPITDSPLMPSGFWKIGLASKMDKIEKVQLVANDFCQSEVEDLIHLNQVDEPWKEAGLIKLMSQLGWQENKKNWDKTIEDFETENLNLGIDLLRVSWPEAHSEVLGLITDVIVTNAPIRSSSYFGNYGAIWTGSSQLTRKEIAFELLLHEEGHHALLLKEQFSSFVENPSEIHSHPLRPDPRPLRGVLHAAFVLWRMTNGYKSLLQNVNAEGISFDRSFVVERLDFLTLQFRATIEVLDKYAIWTESGHTLRGAFELEYA